MTNLLNRIKGFHTVKIDKKRLDVSNMQILKEDIFQIVDSGNHNLIVDLSEVTFIDSSGLSVLIGLFKRLNTLNGKLKLCGLKAQPAELLEITQLDKVFTITKKCS